MFNIIKSRYKRVKERRIITFGSFDLFHIGHLNILEKAKNLHKNSYLIVGVSSDKLCADKGKPPIIPFDQRMKIVKSIKFVDQVFCEESLEEKPEYIREFDAEELVMGNDWFGKFDDMPCKVTYLPRTPSISTTSILSRIYSQNEDFSNKFASKCFYVLDYSGKHKAVSKYFLEELASLGCRILTEGSIPEDVDVFIGFNRTKQVEYVRENYPNTPLVLIDHGASHLKWFLADLNRYKLFDYFLVAGPDHETVYKNLYGSNHNVKGLGYVGSQRVLAKNCAPKDQVCKKYNLDIDKPIVFIAPTWFSELSDDLRILAKEIEKIENHVVIEHFQDPKVSLKNASSKINCFQSSDEYSSYDVLPYAEVVISDTSSILIEASAIGKKLVQIKKKHYSDSPSGDYMLPVIAGSRKYFKLGETCKPSQLFNKYLKVIEDEVDNSELVARHLEGIYISDSINQFVVEELLNIASSKVHNEPEQPRVMSNEDAKSLLNEVSNSILGRDLSSQNMDICNQIRTGSMNIAAAKYFLFNRKEYREDYQFLVGHACGKYADVIYSNSKEALLGNIELGQKLFEADILMTKDNHVILAHANHEKNYGLTEKYISQLTLNEFLESSYADKCTTLSFAELVKILSKNSEVKVILDIGSDYFKTIEYIAEFLSSNNPRCFSQIIPQVFDANTFNVAKKYPFHGLLFAIWKHNDHDPFSEKVINSINSFMDEEPLRFFGVSLRYQNPADGSNQSKNPKVNRLFGTGARIFVHGIDNRNADQQVKDLLDNDFGVFVHNVSSALNYKKKYIKEG